MTTSTFNRSVAVLIGGMTIACSAASAKDKPGDGRILRKEVTITCSLDDVWRAWTTSEGMASFFSPTSNIELDPGKPYEMFMNMSKPDESGGRGSEGCKTLGFIPKEMLSFEWNFPPKVPTLRNAHEKTFVVLRFIDLGDGQIKVKFAQLGWKKGKDWDEGYKYFDAAWGHVLDNLKKTLESRGGKPADDTAAKVKTWKDGQVKVTSIIGDSKRQDFEMTIPVSTKKVWSLLATPEGFEKLGGKNPKVELRPWGAYSYWPGAPNKVLSFIPKEMLSTTGSAPPEFPTVRKGGTWSAYFLEPAGKGKTKLRLCVVGWKRGEEWEKAYDYFLKNNPIFLNQLYGVLAKGDARADAGGVLRHEAIVNAPAEKVWEALTTNKGIESWMVAKCEIDLRVGGKMLTHYDPKGTIGDENTIENTILSFEPNRMLSIKATKPPKNFPFKVAIDNMWTVLRLEPVGANQTRVTCTGMGYADDEESRKMRKFFEQGNEWTVNKLKERFGKPKDNAARPEPSEFAVATKQPSDSAPQSPLALLDPLIGTWEADQPEKNGEQFHARVVYEKALSGRVVNAKSFAIKDDKPSLVYETVFGWHPKDKKAVWRSYSAWGSMYDGQLERKGDTYTFEWDGFLDDKTIRYRQTIAVKGDQYDWVVYARKGDEWHKEKSATFRRIDGKSASAGRDTFESYAAHVGAAEASLRLNEIAEMRRWLDEAPEPMRNWEWRHLKSLSDESLDSFEAHKTGVISIALSPDGTRIATGGNDGAVKTWDAATGKSQSLIKAHTAPIFCVAFSPDGRFLASSSQDGTAKIWDPASGELIAMYKGHGKPVPFVSFSPDSKQIASCAYYLPAGAGPDQIDGQVHIWSIQDDDEAFAQRVLKKGGNKPLSSLAWSPDGNQIAAGSWSGHVYLWNLVDKAQTAPFEFTIPDENLYSAVNSIAIGPDGRFLVAGSKDHTARVWDLKTNELVETLRGHTDYVNTVRFNSSGTTLATGGADDCLRIWDVKSWKPTAVLRGHQMDVMSLAWTTGGTRLASCSLDGSVRWWDSAFPNYGGLSMEQSDACYAALFGPDGRKLHTCGYDGTISIWDAMSGKQIAHWTAHPGNSTNTIGLSADGKRLVSCSWDKTAKVWDTQTQKEIATLDHEQGIYHAAISPDGKHVACTQKKEIWVWDVDAKSVQFNIDGHEGGVQSVAFSPDGTLIASSAADKTVRVWKADSGDQLAVMQGHTGGIESCAFSSDGELIASASADGSIRLWNTATGKQVRVLYEGDDRIYRVAFSPDNSRVAAGGGRCLILDVNNGGSVAALRPSKDAIWHLSFSPDGSRLACASVDKSITILDSRPVRETIAHNEQHASALKGQSAP
jgi:WD40 repeat protein/uncharacterized protein YndB with AHSA1/START domain